MDYEKKYNDALNDMRAIYPNLKGDAKLAVEHAFSELRESEDERVRYDIMEAVENWFPYERVEEIRYYIEKRKKEIDKRLERVEQLHKEFQELDAEMKSLHRKMYGEEHKEQDECPEYCVRSHCMGCSIYEKQKEQKPAEWSEEDEKIITALTKALIGSDSAEKIMLFDGVTIEMVSDLLKSLRPSWRPSEEQMEAFRSYIKDFQEKAEAAVGGWNNFDVMIRLYEQLKKL